MASKLVSGLGMGRRVAAATAERARNRKAMKGFIARCSDVVPPGHDDSHPRGVPYYLGRQMEHEIEEVSGSDDDNVRQLVDLDAMRQERDQAVVEVYGTVLKTRQGFELTHGEGSGKKLLGLDTEVPDDPVRLCQTANRCRSWLRDPSHLLPPPKLQGFRFDREETATGLDTPVDRLGRQGSKRVSRRCSKTASRCPTCGSCCAFSSACSTARPKTSTTPTPTAG